jgi:hypothetical protein
VLARPQDGGTVAKPYQPNSAQKAPKWTKIVMIPQGELAFILINRLKSRGISRAHSLVQVLLIFVQGQLSAGLMRHQDNGLFLKPTKT